MSDPSSGSERFFEPEEELIRRAQERTSEGHHTKQSEDAFTTLFFSYRDRVFAYLLGVMKNKEEAEEALARTFLKVWRGLPDWVSDQKSEAPFKGWIFKIATNEARQHWRDRDRPASVSDAPGWLFGTRPELQADIEDRELIQKALRTLSDQERNVLLLHDRGGVSPKEIARLQKIRALTENQAARKVRDILKQARRKFLRAYNQECQP